MHSSPSKVENESKTAEQTEPMLPTATEESAWFSIYIGGSCAFIQATQFSIFFASMWPYILTLDPNVTQTNFGVVVALYSFSQCICSPAFGYWSNKIGQVRLPLIVGFCFMALGNISYFCLQFLPAYHLYVMMFARFIAGGGTGNMSLLRAYASSASTLKDRSRAIACVSGGIACGSMFGPAFQILFSPLGEEGFTILGVKINIYTSPALLCLCLNIIGLCVVYFLFEEKYIIEMKKKNEETENSSSEKLDNPDIVGILVLIVTRFSQIFLITTVESIGSAYSMMMFTFEKEQAVTISAVSHTVSGSISAALYLAFIFIDLRKFLRVRSFTIIALALSIVWFLVTYPYPFLPNKVDIMTNGSDAGCDVNKYNWCYDLPSISPWPFYIGQIITFSFGYSIMNITTTTLYSKIVGPRPQGTYQGFYQMAGSVGRLVAPLLMSTIYSMYGPVIPWQIIILEVSVVTSLWVILRHRLVPFEKKMGKNTNKDDIENK